MFVNKTDLLKLNFRCKTDLFSKLQELPTGSKVGIDPWVITHGMKLCSTPKDYKTIAVDTLWRIACKEFCIKIEVIKHNDLKLNWP